MSSQPVKSYSLGSALKLSSEADFEDAARIGSDIYLITSHGRNKDGKLISDRYRFARLAVTGTGSSTAISVKGYTKTLIQSMLTSANWTTPDTAVITLLNERSQLSKSTVANLAPKLDGLNIEGLAQLPGTTLRLAIGLRNPLINNNAIVVTLENPLAATSGQTPKFGQAIRLDLGGNGIRAMAYSPTQNMIYIIAGHINSDPAAQFFVYQWSGSPNDAPVYVTDITHASGGSYEAILPPDGVSAQVRLIVDEGAVLINGVENKTQSASKQLFHDVILP
jgi:hypothetical protein